MTRFGLEATIYGNHSMDVWNSNFSMSKAKCGVFNVGSAIGLSIDNGNFSLHDVNFTNVASTKGSAIAVSFI